MTQQIFKVTSAANVLEIKPRLIKAEKRRHVEGLVLQDFEISKASAEECVALGAAGIVVEMAE